MAFCLFQHEISCGFLSKRIAVGASIAADAAAAATAYVTNADFRPIEDIHSADEFSEEVSGYVFMCHQYLRRHR